MDDSGRPVADGNMGSIVLKLPLPPGALPTLWNNDARYQEAYLDRFPGYYLTGDAGYRDSDGYLWCPASTSSMAPVERRWPATLMISSVRVMTNA